MKPAQTKKVTAFIGSPRQGATYRAVQEFEANLKSRADIDFEYVWLKDCHLEYCKGCCLCFAKGEHYCPAQDDRDALLEKLENSDGVVFAAPAYSLQVPALMKNFLDRLAFVLHRPRFFGKAFTAIVPYGIFGGGSVVRYLESVGEALGFDVARGCSLWTLEPTTERQEQKIAQELRKAATRFCKVLTRDAPPAPSFLRLMIFRMSRTSMRLMLGDEFPDYRYFRERGWFKSAYYCDVPLGFVKRLAGRLFDFLGVWIVKRSRRSSQLTTRRADLSGGPFRLARR